ncbi:hypothetical protein W911_13770 [Hyphomicrobium nitrativorans NL23]|uniref:Inverse autotransporter beta-domain domain-containing protein n=1 Tax=Hyphomicrobium nitrativorans NL23 TaxID=1029756 RepID=V5SHH5_9HYPH|nr:inverse autotransporter beta-barrel domain-containing protein [Hyphomicrobium nitrativorans]AHB50301.1 hypothetical protein W911_13770 [Hyphomicrobium nitrativorans NL23]
MPWLELGGFYGSNDSSRGEAALWVPLAQSHNSVLFGEARGKLFEDDMREGNFALGYRQMQANGWNLGLWGGYDIRESQFGNTFHQFAGGIEALSDRWDVRANAYLPLNDSETLFRSSTFTPTAAPIINLTGTSIGLTTTGITTTTMLDELALHGFDAEIGAKILSTPLDLTGPSHELRLYAGAFHFDHSDLPNSVSGPRVRAEWRMDDVIARWAGSRLTIEAEYSHDQLRDDRVEIGARLRLPFGDSGTRVASRSLTAQERRMSEGLERDTDVVTGTTTTSSSSASSITEAVEDAKTGVRFDRVARADGAADITTASTSAGANSLIIATGNINGAQELQGDQTLQGGGSTIQVRGVTSGIVVDFTAPGSRPAVTHDAYFGPVLAALSSNTHIAGLDLTGGGSNSNNFGIQVFSGSTNVHIDSVNVSNTNHVGIFLGFETSVAISNSLVQQTASHGIHIESNSSLTVSNTTIVDPVRSGIFVGTNSYLSATDIEMRNVGTDGLYFVLGGTARISGMTIENAGNRGIHVLHNTDLTLNESVLKGTFGGEGILASGSNITFSGAGNTVEPGTTFGNGFCNAAGVTGSLEFNIGNCP